MNTAKACMWDLITLTFEMRANGASDGTTHNDVSMLLPESIDPVVPDERR